MNQQSTWPIGVFVSIDAGLGVHFDVVRELEIPTVQVHAPHAGNRTPEQAREFKSRCDDAGVQITAVFGGFDGETYESIARTAETVGLVPAETRRARVDEMKEISDFTKELGCDVVALHLGFVPEDHASEDYTDLVAVTRELLDHVAGNGQNLHLETGQETAAHLLDFLEAVDRDNLFINFDPANMILYGTGDPIAALKKVGHRVRSVHCKDAVWADDDDRGVNWGKEVPLGRGDVGMETYLRTLDEVGYHGPLTIEREIPEDPARQKTDIGQAVRLLRDLRTKIL